MVTEGQRNLVEAAERQAFPDRLLTTPQTAQMLGLSRGTLEHWRIATRYDEGLPWVRVGSLVRYRLSDVMAWIESRVEGGEHR